MKKPFRMAASLVLAGVMTFTAVGCSKTPASDVGQAPAQSAAGDAGKGAADNKPITLTGFSGNNANWDDMQSEVGKIIQQKTGVSLKMEFSLSSTDQKIPLMISSGQYPDLILPSGDAGKLVDAGALIDLTDLIDKYAPNLKKIYGPYMKRLRWSNDDHAIYVLPTLGGVDQTDFDAGGIFALQHAVVKELGYPKIRTLQDYENVIKTYKDKHPTIDGKPTIGLSLNADDWRILISVTNPAVYATGLQDDGEFYIDPKTYQASLHYLRPEEKEYFRWLNHMNDIGLMDPESFVQKFDQYNAKIASGRVLGLIDAWWDIGGGVDALNKDGKSDRTYGFYPVTMNENIKDHSFQDRGYLAGWGTAITKSNKDPVRTIKFLDWLASDEAQVLNNWGVEGVDYKVENGKRVIPPDQLERRTKDTANWQKATGIGNYGGFSARWGDGVTDPTGNTYTTNNVEQIVQKYPDAAKDVLSHYNAKTWKDLFPKKEEFPVKPWGAAWNIPMPTGSDADVIFQKCEEIMKKRVPEAILAKPDQFDTVWQNFMNDLDKAGAKKLGEMYTKLVQDRVKLWNE
ncbi:ABC transporter substrate-binding protein [Paenibacillus andongensis]|uniref:ABC transporter substrate-binding protein n=1 Tax=Paenibacillus andongensis TaxID=2975482 RepID=UPI0021BA7369|nr:ABC transporter substrate-binding protein [Paenibacillus andongensis]